MNGVGADTTIKVLELQVISIVRVILIAAAVIFVLSFVMLMVSKRKFKKSQVYTSYMEFKQMNQ